MLVREFQDLQMYVAKGVYEDNSVFEVVLTTKGEAVKKKKSF